MPQLPAFAFRLAGFPVRVDTLFLLTALLLGWPFARQPALLAAWLVVVFVSVLWHELGHAVAFRCYGVEVDISLQAFGGVTTPLSAVSLTPRREIVVSLAGPLAGFLLGGGAFLFAQLLAAPGALATAVLVQLVWVNLAWGLFNLLPLLPLDGGRVLAAVTRRVSRGRGERAAMVVSVVVAALCVLAALRAGWWFAAVMAGLMGHANWRGLAAGRAKAGSAPAPTAEAWIEQGHRELRRGNVEAAGRIAESLMIDPPSAAAHSAAASLYMWVCLLDGRLEEAAHVVQSAPPAYGASRVLSDSVVESVGGADVALRLLERVFQAHPSDSLAAQLCRALVESERLDDAVAVSEGDTAGVGTAALVGHALYVAGEYEKAARVGERAFGREPHPSLAYNIACSWARAGETDAALTWLERAVDVGFDDLSGLDDAPDLVLLRGSPSYEVLRRRVSPASAR